MIGEMSWSVTSFPYNPEGLSLYLQFSCKSLVTVLCALILTPGSRHRTIPRAYGAAKLVTSELSERPCVTIYNVEQLNMILHINLCVSYAWTRICIHTWTHTTHTRGYSIDVLIYTVIWPFKITMHTEWWYIQYLVGERTPPKQRFINICLGVVVALNS